MMLRKQIMITEAHENYLHALSEATGESQGHIVRQAIELHASQLHPSNIPGLIYEEQTTENKTDELKS